MSKHRWALHECYCVSFGQLCVPISVSLALSGIRVEAQQALKTSRTKIPRKMTLGSVLGFLGNPASRSRISARQPKTFWRLVEFWAWLPGWCLQLPHTDSLWFHCYRHTFLCHRKSFLFHTKLHFIFRWCWRYRLYVRRGDLRTVVPEL